MKKSDFNIPDGKLERFLDICQEIIEHNECVHSYGFECHECPFYDWFNGKDCHMKSVANANKFIKLFKDDVDSENEKIIVAKQFIELFGGSMTEQELYQKWQKEWIKFHNVEVGDVVKVVAKTIDNHLGWGDDWCMNEYIDKELKVIEINDDSVELEDDSCVSLSYPFFCLEYISKEETEIIMTVAEIEKKLNIKNLHVVK